MKQNRQVYSLALMLHLSERSQELTEGEFKAGFDMAIEEAGAFIKSEYQPPVREGGE